MKQLPSNVTGKDAMAETLTAFQIFLQNRDMSPNTISSYMFGAKDFLERYGEITRNISAFTKPILSITTVRRL